jgi:hypothetical protein
MQELDSTVNGWQCFQWDYHNEALGSFRSSIHTE